MKILIADDNVTMRQMIENIIRSVGVFEIDTAANGIDALRLYRQKRHDLLLIDNLMPQMDGIDALRELKDDQFIYRTHVIMITGTITKQLVSTIKSEMLKIDDIISKPFNFEKVREKISNAVVSYRRRNPQSGPVINVGEKVETVRIMPLNYNVIDRGNITILEFAGGLNNINKSIISDALRDLQAIFSKTVVIDINAIEQIDCFGYGTLAVMNGFLAVNDKDVYIAWDDCPMRDRLISLGINSLVPEFSGALNPMEDA